MKMEIQIINRYNGESATVRLTIFDDNDGSVTDILEGQTRFIVTQVLKRISPTTKLELRKVR